MMNEAIKTWLRNLYEDAIKETKEAIKNEHIWELGYDDPEDEFNPHTSNIEQLEEYIEVLEGLIEELD